MLRNRRRDAAMASDGLDAEERARRGKELGEEDVTDFENPYVSLHLMYRVEFTES